MKVFEPKTEAITGDISHERVKPTVTTYYLKYDFLGVDCAFETTDLFTFVSKLCELEEKAEVLNNSISFYSEKK